LPKTKQPAKIKVRERGQITIPTKIRNRYGITENAILVIKPLKNGLLLEPERNIIKEIQRRGAALLRRKGLTVNDLLKQLDEDEQ